MAIVYLNQVPLIGNGGFKGNNFLATKYLYLIDPDEVIASASTVALEATYQTLIANQKLIPLGEVFSLERTDVEAKYEQGLSGESVKTMPEMKAFKAHFNWNEDQKKQAYSIEGKEWRLIIGDAGGQLKLQKEGSGFKGFELLSCYVMGKEPSDAAVGVTTVFIQMADTEAVEQLAWIQPVDFALSDLKAVTSITAACGTVSTNTCTLTATYASPSYGTTAGVVRTGTISGLVAANIAIYSAAGAARATVTCVASTTVAGQYTIGAVAFVATDTVQVIPSSTNLYKSNIVTTA